MSQVFLPLLTLCLQFGKPHVIASFTYLVNFYFLVSPLRIKIFPNTNYNPQGEVAFVSSTEKRIPHKHNGGPTWSLSFRAVSKAASMQPNKTKVRCSILGTKSGLNTSPEAGMEIRFRYKVAMWIMQHIFLLIFFRLSSKPKTLF